MVIFIFKTRRTLRDKQGHFIIMVNSSRPSLVAFPGGASGKEYACQSRRHKRQRFDPWVRKIPWRSKWYPTPVFLPEKSHGQRGLVGYSPKGRKELDPTRESEHTAQTSRDSYKCVCAQYHSFKIHETIFDRIKRRKGQTNSHKRF